MNASGRQDSLRDAFNKNFITFSLGLIINCINAAFVYTYIRNQEFHRDPRYVLYIHLVVNDMIMLAFSVALQVLTYTVQLGFVPCCVILLVLVTTNKNSPLNLAVMAVERYVAVCRPLRHAQLCTVGRAHALIGLIWTASLVPALADVVIVLLAAPGAVSSRNVICYSSYVYVTPYHRTKSVLVQVLLFSFVFLTLVVTYLKVLIAARAVSGADRTSAGSARNTILLHGVQLLVCMLSYAAPPLNRALVTAWPRQRTNVLFGSFLVTNVLPRLLSPLIYGVRDQRFSGRLRLHFCCKRRSMAGGEVDATRRRRFKHRQKSSGGVAPPPSKQSPPPKRNLCKHK